MGEHEKLVPDFADGCVHLPGGYTLAWVVDDEGDRWPFILDDYITATAMVPYRTGIEALAAHERVGPLPVDTRDALGLVQRCGAPTTAGRPCRARVTEPGDRCVAHRGDRRA